MWTSGARFLTSAAHAHQFPKSRAWEFVVVGRSNVGKSSLINRLTHHHHLAYVGKQPGKTRLVNFYEVAEGLLVDVPGYGYARRSQAELKRYGQLMEAYFSNRHLNGVVVLIDSRHPLSIEDQDMIEFVEKQSLPMVIVANKVDKLNQTQKAQAHKRLTALGHPFIFFSALKHTGTTEIQQWIEKNIEA